MEYILEIKGLTKSYKDFQMKDISFSIPKGTIMGFIGENGAGKTTTIKAILRLIEIENGKIEVFGKDMVTFEKENKEQIGVVLADSMFPEAMYAKQIDRVMNTLYKQWDSTLFFKYIEHFSLPMKKTIKQFSKGMKMKLAIAIALSHHPKLLILDEATSGLDPIVRDEMLDIFLEFIEDGEKSVLISSHITSDIEKAADYVTFMHKGQILLSEEKDRILDSYGILKATPTMLDRITSCDYIGLRKSAFQIEVLVKNKDAIRKRFPDAIIDNATLEDIMLYTVKGAN